MARIVKSMMGVALVAAMALPAASAHAVMYNSPAPTSSFNLQSLLQQQLMGQAGLSQLSMMNGLNIGNMTGADFGKMLLMSAATSMMSGQFDMQSLMGNMANMALIGSLGQLGGMQIGGMPGMPGMPTTGIPGMPSTGTNFGAFNMNTMLTTALGTVLQQAMGGIQGGTTSTGTSLGTNPTAGMSYDPLTGMYYDTTTGQPVLTTNTSDPTPAEVLHLDADAKVNKQSDNYKAGLMAALTGQRKEADYMVSSNEYDANYLAGYKMGVKTEKDDN